MLNFKVLPADSAPPRPAQPSHTLYGGAHLFRSDSAQKLTRTARLWFERYGSESGWSGETLEALNRRFQSDNLVEDLRIDFEDGYGQRGDDEEDGHARAAARHLKEAPTGPRVGLRIKALTQRWAGRALRTLTLFAEELQGYPGPLRLTLPKTTRDEQVALLGVTLDQLGQRYGLVDWDVELMVESPDALPRVARWVEVESRIRAVHFGPFDFLAACGVTQGDLHHPLCRAAKAQLLFTLAGTSVEWADGPTTQLPIAAAEGSVGAAWRRHQDDLRRSRGQGFYQSWLLHPGQLVSLQAQLVEELAESWRPAARRLKNFLDQAGQATRVGEQFDDRATARLLQLHVQQAYNAGLAGSEELLTELGAGWDTFKF